MFDVAFLYLDIKRNIVNIAMFVLPLDVGAHINMLISEFNAQSFTFVWILFNV